MNLATVRVKGYILQVELAWRTVQLGADVDELPTAFATALKAKASSAGSPSRKHWRKYPKIYLLGLGSR